MPRVGSDRGQIGLDQLGSDWTDLDWIDLTQMEIRLDEMGSDQMGSDRLRFPLDCRYLRVRDVRYPHPSHHGHRTPEKAEKRWRTVSDGRMMKCSLAVVYAVTLASQLPRASNTSKDL